MEIWETGKSNLKLLSTFDESEPISAKYLQSKHFTLGHIEYLWTFEPNSLFLEPTSINEEHKIRQIWEKRQNELNFILNNKSGMTYSLTPELKRKIAASKSAFYYAAYIYRPELVDIAKYQTALDITINKLKVLENSDSKSSEIFYHLGCFTMYKSVCNSPFGPNFHLLYCERSILYWQWRMNSLKNND